MTVVVSIMGSTATLSNYVWTSTDKLVANTLNAYVPVGGFATHIPDPDYELAQAMITKFGGKIISNTPPVWIPDYHPRTSLLDKVLKHLPGQHNQLDHGRKQNSTDLRSDESAEWMLEYHDSATPISEMSMNSVYILEFANGRKSIGKTIQPNRQYGIDADHVRQEAINEVTVASLAKILNVNVPPTVAVKDSGSSYTIKQEFVDGKNGGELYSLKKVYQRLQEHPDHLFRAAILDFITGQTDRHVGNVMFTKTSFALVDNGNTTQPSNMTNLKLCVGQASTEDRSLMVSAYNKIFDANSAPTKEQFNILNSVIKAKQFPKPIRARAEFLKRLWTETNSTQIPPMTKESDWINTESKLWNSVVAQYNNEDDK